MIEEFKSKSNDLRVMIKNFNICMLWLQSIFGTTKKVYYVLNNLISKRQKLINLILDHTNKDVNLMIYADNMNEKNFVYVQE